MAFLFYETQTILMEKGMKTLILIVVLSLVSLPAFGQYYGERVMEKSFEQTDFFFTPSFVNPLGIRGYVTALTGLMRDPLLDLQVNPANLFRDSARTTYTYIDFRSTRTVIDQPQYVYPMYEARVASYDMIMPYPRYYATTRKQLDPVFSAAVLTRPVRSIPELFVGVTYQLVFQNDEYYSIPQDIYRSSYGYDYAGNRMAAEADIPIVDKYSGNDDMRLRGHFGVVHAGLELSDALTIGARVSRVTFDRDGAFGSKNFNEYTYTPQSSSTSVWYNMESRAQEYSHWDVSGGVEYSGIEGLDFGVSLGGLVGTATQTLGRLDTSFYRYGQPNSGDYWNNSRRFAISSQDWSHDGETYYGGFDLRYRANERQVFVLTYGFQRQDVDLRLGSSIVDSSSYDYRSSWNSNVYTGNSRYRLSDFRTGSGTKTGRSHRLLAGLQWSVESNLDLNIGVVYEWQKYETITDEPVSSSHHSEGSYTSPDYNNLYLYGGSEQKNLLWNFTVDRATIQIPVMLTWRASENVQVLLGLNRQLADWTIEEQTLAVFRYREEYDTSGTVRKENFGERYTAPTERISDVRTTFLAGITVAPSKSFDVRLLFTPTQLIFPNGFSEEDSQWWIGIRLYP